MTARTLSALLALVAIAGCVATPGTGTATEIQFENATAAAGLSYGASGFGDAGNGNAGVYVADVDSNGWQDVLVIGGDQPALFVNDDGTFERSDALPVIEGTVKSAHVLDREGDGAPDLLLLRTYAPPVLLANDGDGSFHRVDSGIGNLTFPLGATSADFDGDGDADLLVYQSGDWAEGTPRGHLALNGSIDDDNGNPNLLFANEGGSFERVEDAGLAGDRWSLAASAVDLNDDGHPDFHVANDFNNDTIAINDGDGTFTQRSLPAPTARNGMASEIGDFDGDGDPDVFTTNIELPIPDGMSDERFESLRRLLSFVLLSSRTDGNTLMLNDGNGTFTDGADAYGVRVGGWGWAATHTDFDSDGEADILTTTQNVVRMNREDPHFTYPMLWERTGENFTTLDASEHGFHETDGRGMATLDYDRDGDRDVIVAQYDGPVHVYENVGTTGNALQVRVVDDNGVTVEGATVTVTAGSRSRTIQQTDRTDFLSQESRVRHFGLDGAETATIQVFWPDGTERTFEGVGANQQVQVTTAGVETVWEFDDG